MKQIIDEYGKTILLIIIASMCLVMFVNLWFGSGSFLANLATTVFHVSTQDATTTSTGDDKMYIVGADGALTQESQQKTASKSEEIANRTEPKLYGVGTQNNSDQLLIGNTYHSTDLLWAIDADGAKIETSLTRTNAINDAEYYNESGYFRILSISQANGNELISNCSDFKSIAYKDQTYDDKKGGSGSNSYVTNTMFAIKTPANEDWLTYNMSTQQWYFYKAGTYCFRVLVCDSKGKSMTGTVYISVAKNLTQNNGDGNSAGEH